MLNPSTGEFLKFLLVLTRVSSIFFLAPVLGSRNIPAQVKIGMSLIISIALAPFVADVNISPSINPIDLALLIAKEASIGAIIGFTATLIFMSFLLAGEIIDFQMGFGMVNVVDPLSNVTISIVGQVKNLLAILVFLAINAHHYLLTALAQSFDIVPLTAFALTPAITNNFVNMVTNMFVIGLKIGAPAIGILFITDLALGILARTVPQMNVFIVGIPLKITIGFLSIIVMMSFLTAYMIRLFGQMPEQLLNAIR